MTDDITEDKEKASNHNAATESKIKMYGSQIAAHGDPGGKRRNAIRKLQDQLKSHASDIKSS